MQICEQKLDKHNIPKKYLKDKKFSYKLYINLCDIAFWSYEEDNYNNKFIEYRLFNYNLTQMSKIFSISINTIKNKISKKPYRDKNNIYELDENMNLKKEYLYNRTKYLMFNSPKKEYTTINSKIIIKIKTLDEMTIRFYILLNSMKNKTIYNLSQKGILELIGYNGNSHNNRNKLTESVKTLEKLKLIKTESTYENSMKFLSYKIK